MATQLNPVGERFAASLISQGKVNKVNQGEKKAAAAVTLQFSASFVAPATPDQPTGLQGIAYSGGIIPGYGGLGDCIIDLASVQFSPSIFILVNHDPNQRAGRATLSVADHQLQVAGQFSQATPTGQQIAAEFAEGAPFQFSVGIAADLEYSQDKVTRTVNGQNVAVNTVFSNPRVLEASLVPAGADPHTSAAAFSAVIDLPLISEATMPTSAPSVDATELDRLQADNKALSEKLATLQAQLTATRTQEVKALFADLGVTPTHEELQQFIDLSGEVFTVVATRLREKAKPSAPAHLFAVQTAGNGESSPEAAKMPSPAEIYERRRQAAAKARGAV